MDLGDPRREAFPKVREELRWRVALVLALLISLVMATLGVINTRLSTIDTALLSWAVLCICLGCVIVLLRLPKDKGATVFFITMATILVGVMAYGMVFDRSMQHWAYIFPPVVAFLLRAGPALIAMLAFGVYAALMLSANAPAVDVVRFSSAYGLVVCFMYTYALLQEKAARMLRHQSNHDALTRCLNRRRFNETMEKLQSGRLGASSCTILLIDLDEFKSVNDRLGHLAGDRIITHTAMTLAGVLREGSLLFRYGGEEFAVLLPNARDGEGLRVAERLRQAVAETSTDGVSVTVSIGLAQWREGEGTALESLDHADQALYQAKRAGRNCIISHSAAENSPAGP